MCELKKALGMERRLREGRAEPSDNNQNLMSAMQSAKTARRVIACLVQKYWSYNEWVNRNGGPLI